MSKKEKDDRKQLLVRYRIDKDGKVSFVDPCSDDIPANLFFQIMKALSGCEDEWNNKMAQKQIASTLKYDVMSEAGCTYENTSSCILMVGGTCGQCRHNE